MKNSSSVFFVSIIFFWMIGSSFLMSDEEVNYLDNYRLDLKGITADPYLNGVLYQFVRNNPNAIEAIQFRILNGTDNFITSIKYKAVVKDPNGKILFNKVYQQKINISNDLGMEWSEKIMLYIDKPIKSKWQISTQSHVFSIEALSITIDKEKTAEGIAAKCGRFSYRCDDYTGYYLVVETDKASGKALLKNWEKIFELSPNFLENKHEDKKVKEAVELYKKYKQHIPLL